MFKWIASLFKSKEENMEEEQRDKMSEDSKKEEEERSKKEKDAKEANKKKIDMERSAVEAKKEEELAEEKKKNIEKLNKSVADYNSTIADLQKEIEEVEKQLKTNTEEQIEVLKQEGIDVIKLDKDRLENEKKTLEQKREFLLKDYGKLQEAKKEGQQKMDKLVELSRYKEKMKIEAHNKEILDINAQKHNIIEKMDNVLTGLADEHGKFQKEMLKQNLQLQGTQMNNSVALMGIMNGDQQYEDFRKSCGSLVNGFNTLQRAMSAEEQIIYSSLNEMDNELSLSDLPCFDTTLRNLQHLTAQFTEFVPQGCDDPKAFEEYRDQAIELLQKLGPILKNLDAEIQAYERKMTSKSNSNTPLRNEEFEDLAPSPAARDDKAPKSIEKVKKMHSDATETMNSLSKIVLKFNVPASTKFNDTLMVQFNQMSIQHAQVTQQITNGSNQASVNQIMNADDDSNSDIEEEGVNLED